VSTETGPAGVRSILSPAGRQLVASFARSNLLIAFDYDGTLAPIARRPRGARLPAATRRLLRQVAGRYGCLVISGRAYSDIARRLRGVPLRFVFGNHGIEPLWAGARSAALVRRWTVHLERQLADCAGVFIENKTHSLAIHYRHARNRARARRRIAAAVRGLRGARAIEGKAAVNVIPARGVNKGTALRRACRLAGCTRAMYVGDDGTDEDAFGALPPERLLAVRVGRRRGSRARYLLRRQADIDALLRLLLDVRLKADASDTLKPRKPARQLS
jgi:trehalose 6-phosphate phosphatase